MTWQQDGDWERVMTDTPLDAVGLAEAAKAIAKLGPDILRDAAWHELPDYAQEMYRAEAEAAIRAYLARAEPAGWRMIETAPWACHFYATYWDEEMGEWIVGVIMRGDSGPWTHWQFLPAAPLPTPQGDETK